jgi:putative glutamate/gamma-aminobutyrate antiporter
LEEEMASEDLSVPRGRIGPREVAKAVSKPQFITWTALAFMTVSSVASLRPAPTMAVYGISSIFLYGFAALVFLIPTALVAAELASGWTGGVYRWVTEGISAKYGFLAVWCQFAMTIFYYPSLLAFVASTLAYVINPDLASSGVYTAVIIIGVYWLGVLVSSQGTKALAGLASSGLIIGTLIPGVLLIVLGVIYLGDGNTSAAPMKAEFIIPAWTGIASLVLIVNNFLSYSGMEMNAVHVSELKQPGKEFPRGMFLAMGLVLAIFILPALAISWVVPAEDLTLTAGLMQAFDAFFSYFNMAWLTPVIGIMILCASLAGMLTWLAGPSKGLLLIGRKEGYLPPHFQKMNSHGIQQNILVAQGFVTTVIGLAYAFIPDVSSAYWIFSVMTTQVYLVMYVLMFIAAISLRRRAPDHERGFKAPALTFLCAVGIVASVAAFAIGFVPPSQFESGSTTTYLLIVGGGVLLIGFVVPGATYAMRKPSWKTAEGEEPGEATPSIETPSAPAAAPAGATSTMALQGGGEEELPPTTSGEIDPEKQPTGDHPTRRKLIYAGAGFLAGVAVIAGLVSFKDRNHDEEAQAKADEVIAMFQENGFRTPQKDLVVNLLGTDGGKVCEDPASALQNSVYKMTQLSNGAAQVGLRPVITDQDVVQGQLVILDVYCPDQAAKVRAQLDDLKYDDVVHQ